MKEKFEQSLKYDRDIKNVVDTSFEEGKKEVAKKMKDEGFTIELIIKLTGLTKEDIDNLYPPD